MKKKLKIKLIKTNNLLIKILKENKYQFKSSVSKIIINDLIHTLKMKNKLLEGHYEIIDDDII